MEWIQEPNFEYDEIQLYGCEKRVHCGLYVCFTREKEGICGFRLCSTRFCGKDM